MVMPETWGNRPLGLGRRDSPFSIAAASTAPDTSNVTRRLPNGSSASTSRRVSVVPGG